MILIIASIFLSISIVIFSFLGFSPNIHRIVEGDYMRKAYSNAAKYGIQYGELATRADIINATNSTLVLEQGYLKGLNGRPQDDLSCEITLNNSTIELEIKHDMLPAD
ncbi:MAG: hypothetical protein JW788_00760 [Candidatus Omnitrophica bacterium]|nr:hypothetical protein [Candidatus Omnitrophota bacterium]